MTGSGADVVVIGGGIVGTSAAAFLAQAGARTVSVDRASWKRATAGSSSGRIGRTVNGTPSLVV